MTEYMIRPHTIETIKNLTTPTVKFDFTNPPIDPYQLTTSLLETMHQYNGIGLAANQVDLPYRVFVMKGDPNFACFNPRIVMPSTETIALEEACLSFPGVVVKVTRPRSIRVRFQTPSGETVTKQFTGLSARVFQHELDHLDGILYYNRSSRLEREMAKKKAKKHGYSIQKKRISWDQFIDGAESAYFSDASSKGSASGS